MRDYKAFLDQYVQLVHIYCGEHGERVNWIGHFAGLRDPIAEGFAYEATLKDGRPWVRPVRNGYTVRLYTQKLQYASLGHFRCIRRKDTAAFLCPTPEVVRIPCIAAHAVTTDHLYDDPYFKTIRRRIAVLNAVQCGDGAGLRLRFEEEEVA